MLILKCGKLRQEAGTSPGCGGLRPLRGFDRSGVLIRITVAVALWGPDGGRGFQAGSDGVLVPGESAPVQSPAQNLIERRSRVVGDCSALQRAFPGALNPLGVLVVTSGRITGLGDWQ